MLELEIQGDGPVVVVLHGVPVPPESVDMVRRHLQTSHRVMVPDLHGCGMLPDEAIDALLETLHHHGVHEASLVGHSLGAYRAF